jgi:hypothetical protein
MLDMLHDTAAISPDTQTELDLTLVVPCRVAHVLRRTPELSGCGISWYVEERTLILRGRVCSFYQKQVAQAVALRLDGFERVVNELEVDTAHRITRDAGPPIA